MTNGQAFSGLCVTFFLMLASFGMYTYLGSWLATAFHLKVTMVGIIIVAVGVGNFVGNMVGGFLSDRYGKRGMLMWALTVMAVTLFMLPHTVYSLTSALICIFVWMVSGGLP